MHADQPFHNQWNMESPYLSRGAFVLKRSVTKYGWVGRAKRLDPAYRHRRGDSMTATLSIRPCIKCGSTDRYKSGACKPCTAFRRAVWVKTNPLRAKCVSAAHSANRTARHEYQHSGRITARQVHQLWLDSEGVCGICHQSVNKFEWSLDHRVSFCGGGLNAIENCQISHFLCNYKKDAGFKPQDKPSQM
jgi:hypothetical protein